MAYHMVDTPRTEAADKTMMSHAADLDFSTINSFPSPSKDNNDLIKNLRAMRGADLRTPRLRAPLADRRNVPAKGEFTPLLKSGTKNRLLQAGGANKENLQLNTPIGLRASYNAVSPVLPLNSSIMDETTTSSVGADGNGTPIPAVSSSLLSTPMPTLPTRRDGVLDDNANLLTLREQEARLIQIDKENFSLKLKIHFMEEALRKNGKEFNEAAIRENTELKVDKVTLQRDLRQYRKSLAQAEKDLEEYRRQLLDYAEKVKRRHADEGFQEELERLQQMLAERDEELENLHAKLDGLDNDNQIAQLRGDIEDLEAELREKERMVDEKDDEIQDLQDKIQSSADDHADDVEHAQAIEEKDLQIQELQHSLQQAESQNEELGRERESEMASKDDEISHLRTEVRKLSESQNEGVSQRDSEFAEQAKRIDNLLKQLEEARLAAQRADGLQAELDAANTDLSAELRKKNRLLEDRDHEIHALQLKLDTSQDRDQNLEKLHDDIGDLQHELRDKQREIEEHEERFGSLQDEKNQMEQEFDEELLAAQDRIQELESQELRNLKELQELRERDSGVDRPTPDVLNAAETRLEEMEIQLSQGRDIEKRLQEDINDLHSELSTIREALKEKETALEKAQAENKQLSAQSKRVEVDDSVAKLQVELQKKTDIEADLKEKIENLEDEIEVLQSGLDEAENAALDLQAAKVESDSLRRQVNGLKQDLAKAEADLHEMRARQRADAESISSPSKNDAYYTIDQLNADVARLKQERGELETKLRQSEAALTGAKLDVDTLQLNLESTADSRTQVQSQLRDLQSKLSIQQRELQRQLDSQSAKYELDIQNLEQDLADAQTKAEALSTAKQAAETQITRLKSKIQGLEEDLVTLRASNGTQKASATTATFEERKDLHSMLKKAKLEAEDLVLQVQDRDTRLASVTSKETELRKQLARVREERSTQSARADEALRELEHLHNQHENLQAEIQQHTKQTRKSTGDTPRDAQKIERRHSAELRGLVRQIEYLGARIRREGMFRREMAYSKAFMLKQIEMYTACNAVDLGLIEAMGIPTSTILAEERAKERGVVTLKSVGFMVLATIRMKKAADKWGSVRAKHESVLRKLEDVRSRRRKTVADADLKAKVW